jgi:hypothetical protein
MFNMRMNMRYKRDVEDKLNSNNNNSNNNNSGELQLGRKRKLHEAFPDENFDLPSSKKKKKIEDGINTLTDTVKTY